MSGSMLAEARRAAGLSQQELARVAGTSRPTVSAYEHGRKSPSLATAQRLLAACGFELHAQPITVSSRATTGADAHLPYPTGCHGSTHTARWPPSGSHYG